MRREGDQHRKEGNQRHDGVDETHTHIFKRRGKTHCIFLHTLRGTFDMTQLLPVRHIVFVHCGTPAENIVADEEIIHYTDNHSNQRDAEEDAHFMIKLIDGDLMRRTECSLNQIVERCIPCVDRDTHFDQKPGDEDDE
ncbi:hypothetical protein D3C71_1354020 [compost metagenome]